MNNLIADQEDSLALVDRLIAAERHDLKINPVKLTPNHPREHNRGMRVSVNVETPHGVRPNARENADGQRLAIAPDARVGHNLPCPIRTRKVNHGDQRNVNRTGVDQRPQFRWNIEDQFHITRAIQPVDERPGIEK
jgi:hypothetical protein